MNKMKRIISAIIAITFVLSISTTAVFASRNKNSGTWIPPGIAKKAFDDLGKFPWAQQAIEKMRLKGLIKGKEEGKFAPDNAVTKLETIIMALRVMGWEDETARLELPKRYKGKSVGDWAKGYVALAFDKGLLDDVDMMYFNPEESAKRHEVAKYVVRALGYEKEAQRHMDDKLSFKDAPAIPQGSIGYVYLINDMKLMVGNDGKFNPMGTLTRAEMAVLFNRLDEKINNDDDDDNDYERISKYSGIVTDVSNTSPKKLTIKIDKMIIIFEAVSSVEVYFESDKGSFDEIEVGDSVSVTVDSRNRAEKIYVDREKKEQDTRIIEGVITNIDLSGTYHLSIDNKSYDLSDKADVIIPGQTKSVLKDLKTGYEVTCILKNNIITEIEVEEILTSVTGDIVKATSGAITLNIDGEDKTFEYDNKLTIEIEDQSSKYSNLVAGMKAELKIRNGFVYRINAENKVITVSGKITAITQLSDGYKITLIINKKSVEYNVADDVDISIPDISDEDISDLKVEQKGEFLIQNNIITKIEIED